MGKLVTCKTCKALVDNTAKSCPHCGVSRPGINKKQLSRSQEGWIILFMGGILLVVISQATSRRITVPETSDALYQESHLKGNGLVTCDTEALARDITLNVKRGLIAIAQKQIDAGIAAGSCVTYRQNDTIILTVYNNGYYKFHVKGTDNTLKRSFYVSSELVNNF